ncbi:hypothetical protein OT109_19145 [Phycisphaeraceae bacterium D3-23]
MSESQRKNNNVSAEQVEPLDAFERRWVETLRQPDADIAASGDVFVRGVLDRAEETSAVPPVLARIGWAPLVAAAAVLLVGAVCWAVFFSHGNTADPTPIAEQPTPSPKLAVESPDADNNTGETDVPAPLQTPRTEAERRALAQSLQLGTLIADTSSTFSRPAASFPKTISDTSDQLTLKSLTQGIANPVPDPAEVLPPRRDRPRG